MRLIIGSWPFYLFTLLQLPTPADIPWKASHQATSQGSRQTNCRPSPLPSVFETHPPVSSQRCSKPPAVPALLPHTHLQWTTLILAFKHPSPNSNIYPSPQLQQAFSGNPLTTPAW